MLIQSLIYFVICDETTTVVTTVDTTTGEVITTTTEEETTTTAELTTTTENPANFPKDGKADDKLSRSGLSDIFVNIRDRGAAGGGHRLQRQHVALVSQQQRSQHRRHLGPALPQVYTL